MITENQPLVSIVVPAFNAAEYVGEAISSILDQDYSAVETIVIDDGSTDGTAAVASSFGSKVRFLRQPNAGQSATLNRGWSMARGSLLGYLSADDRLRPGGIAAVVRGLQSSAEAVLAYPDFGLINDRSALINEVHPPDYSRYRLIGQLHCLPGPGALFRRTAFEHAGGWDTTLRQVPDLDFFLRLAVIGPFVRVPHLAADFRVHRESSTYRVGEYDRAEEPLKMIERFYSRSGLPIDIAGWRRESTANAYFLSALMHARSRRRRVAFRRFMDAVSLRPTILFSDRAWALIAILRKPYVAQALA